LNFGLVCGDNYIETYQEGAMLIYGLVLQFETSYDYQTYMKEIGSQLNGIKESAIAISNVLTSNKIHASMSVVAYQRGGDPSLLTK